MKRILISNYLKLLFFLSFTGIGNQHLSAQFQSDPTIGFQVGLVANFGSHVNAMGFTVNVYYADFFYQWNVGSQIKYNLTSYGKRKKYWENRNAFGLVLLGGKRDLTPDFQLDGLNHQTRFSNGIAFNYLLYYDNAGTSQRSGAWGLHLNYFSLAFENDVFGGQSKDRFRTGTLQASYRYGEYKFFVNVYLWTGETRNSFWNRTPMPYCPNGFRCLDSLPYGKTSHGILSFGASRNLIYNQVVTLKTGFDSEQVRHFLQNRLTHDLIFLPRKMERNTPHYPRLNKDGLPVFDKKDIRKSRFFIQGSLNEVWAS